MSLGLLLIIIGIVLAILVHCVLGIIVILIGLALLIVPRLSAAAPDASRTSNLDLDPLLASPRAGRATSGR